MGLNNMFFVKSKKLSKIKHGFFSKLGGVSKGNYSSLNCGYSSNDKKENIEINRKIIANKLNFKIHSLIVPNQYHSNKILLTNHKLNKYKCDGLINFSNKITLGILTADCCPILVAHKRNLLTGCIHVGWKGLYNLILENFVNKIESLKVKKNDVLFALGPSIGRKSYQVSEQFRDNFIKKENFALDFFYYDKINSGLYFDLKGLIFKKLTILGINNIWISKLDTYCEHERFFSYRYSCHKNKKDYGRMLSVIVKN